MGDHSIFGALPEMGKSQGHAKTYQELASCVRHSGMDPRMDPLTRMDRYRVFMKDRQGMQGGSVAL